MSSWYLTSHSGQLSLLLPVGREMSTGQGVLAVLCGWEQGNKGELDTTCVQFGSGGGQIPPPPGDKFVACNRASYRCSKMYFLLCKYLFIFLSFFVWFKIADTSAKR